MKSIFEYIVCILLAVGFSYLLYGRGGLLIAVVLLVAAIVSVALDLLCRNKIKVTVKPPSAHVDKNDTVDFRCVIEKSTPLPTSFIEITVESTQNLKLKSPSVIRTALSLDRIQEINTQLEAVGCGCGQAHIVKCQLCNFLGFKKYKLECDFASYDVGVLPSIVEIMPNRELEKSIAVSDLSEDEEEESDETSYTFGGIAGYEHRPYVDGDPLKKVNWKLSSKRDELMVRLDEKPASASRVMVLDVPFDDDKDYYLKTDMMIQSFLALCAADVCDGFECEAYFYTNQWNCVRVKNYSDVFSMQTMLSEVKMQTPADRMPIELVASGKGALVFTTDKTSEIFDACSAMGACGFVTNNASVVYSHNVWTVTRDYEFKKL